DNSVAVRYDGKPLQPATVYYWKVKTWDNHGVESDFSTIRGFITAKELDGETARYPLQVSDEYPVAIRQFSSQPSVDGNGSPSCGGGKGFYIDFGKTSFGRLKLTLSSGNETDTVTIHLGERIRDGRIDRNPGGSIRYANYRLPLLKGTHTYTLKIRPDSRNTSLTRNIFDLPILMPDYTGEVMPFRSCEIEGYSPALKQPDVVRQTVYYPFDETASHFHSSDTVLNQVWELCKYAIKATSFTGMYIDGDRERIPYEREALISQLGQYCVDREYSIARRSREYLIIHPTWPAEWAMQSVWMAWNDYMYTGNATSLKRFYNDLKAKTLLGLKESNGLISTRTGKVTPETMKPIYFKGKTTSFRDIVDWPHTGILGLGKNELGETDGFVFTDYNIVVNAYHYFSLELIARIAGALGNSQEQTEFTRLAQQMKKDFNRSFLDTKKGYYKDGIDTEHSSLHANMFAMAFGLAPDRYIPSIKAFMHARGMACSISGALVLMEALYENHDAAYALELLSSTSERSWYNTIRLGATLTIEAWDDKYKPDLDWNQSAGSVPANIIPRRLMGIEPLEPGFRKIRIKPQPATLPQAEILMPSIRGDISVSFENSPGEKFTLEIEIPANTTAEVWLPVLSKKYSLTVDDIPQKGKLNGDFVIVETGSGKHKLSNSVMR
ncbi:MAG: alpha-L-rhamnosidase, partial [Dysgonamonadaceae bacterium]|nr:alpha-L-rhamnosidase [Dysgonamonadaceae bacterium]